MRSPTNQFFMGTQEMLADATTIVPWIQKVGTYVSEETGSISVAYKGQFHLRLTAEELERILTKEE